MARTLTLSILLFLATACRTEPLSGPSPASADLAPVAGDTTPCAQILTEDACEARDDCHAVMSGDLPCASIGCSDHFVKCDDKGLVACPGGFDCFAPCQKLEPTCPAGQSPISDGCCISGCVYSDRCAGK